MPPPPPPAPPPPPGPPPPPSLGGFKKKAAGGAAPPRNALLSDIQKGARLKKTVTNDRSAPVFEGNKASGPSTPSTSGNNGPPRPSPPSGPSPPAPGGLFSGGFPQLRPVGSRQNGNSPSPETTRHKTLNGNASRGKGADVRTTGGTRPGPPGGPPRQAGGPTAPIVAGLGPKPTLPSKSTPVPNGPSSSGGRPPPPPRDDKPSIHHSASAVQVGTNHNNNINKFPPKKSNFRNEGYEDRPRTGSQSSVGSAGPPPPVPNINQKPSLPPSLTVAAPPPPPPNRKPSQKPNVASNRERFHTLKPQNSSSNRMDGPVRSTSDENLNRGPPPPQRGPGGGVRGAPPHRPPPPPPKERPSVPPPPPPPHPPQVKQQQPQTPNSAVVFRKPGPPIPPPHTQQQSTNGDLPPPPPPIRDSSRNSQKNLDERFVFCDLAKELPPPDRFTGFNKVFALGGSRKAAPGVPR